MEVILKQDINKLGKAGAVVKVKEGFARNFLLPNNLAIPVTAANLKSLEQEKQKKVLQLEKAKKEAQDLKAKLDGLSLTIPVLVQEGDVLYGSITTADLERNLKEEGFNIDKELISLEEPIKALGIYEIPVKLHPEVGAKIKVWVVKK
ncbi:MAG: 50S ribosomal protein L9 [Candidatus Omnitrophica bacterium]|nr:50S ribosomal protein L9 [Candidatus Omnitrophota bacterium]